MGGGTKEERFKRWPQHRRSWRRNLGASDLSRSALHRSPPQSIQEAVDAAHAIVVSIALPPPQSPPHSPPPRQLSPARGLSRIFLRGWPERASQRTRPRAARAPCEKERGVAARRTSGRTRGWGGVVEPARGRARVGAEAVSVPLHF